SSIGLEVIAGNVTLSGTNTFTGGVSLTTNGTLNIANASALGATNSPLFLGGGTFDNVSGSTLTLPNPETCSASFPFLGSKPIDLGAGTVTMTNNVTATISAASITVGGAFQASNTNALTKAGAGSLVLNGAANPASMTVSAGSVLLN